jgi:6-pyruvoyltetrahydropterin/6-carboxytetrahydropterin synthase
MSDMYEVTVKRAFSAAHTIIIAGAEEGLHGHNFTVEVTLSSEKLDTEGLVLDFRVLKGSENIARFIHEEISKKITAGIASLAKVTVWESETSRATYRCKL